MSCLMTTLAVIWIYVRSFLPSLSTLSHALLRLIFLFFFFFNDAATTEIYTLSLHDALPILTLRIVLKKWWKPKLEKWHFKERQRVCLDGWLKVRSEEHTSELQSQSTTTYAVFCLKNKKHKQKLNNHIILLLIHKINRHQHKSINH